ncbi:MAG: diacylglycerol kinase family protein [Candidatus Micrarchaeaceae archaeon]
MFDRFIVICNPISTDAHKATRKIQDLKHLYPTAEHIIVNTVRGGRSANGRLLSRYADKLGRRTLLCVAGGDGTMNMILHLLLTDSRLGPNAIETVILQLWGGNANDLAFMLNGAPGKSLKPIFDKGRIIAIRPLACTLHRPYRTIMHLAACYASFGASGFAMQELERSIRQRSPMRQPAVTRFGQELVEVSRLLMRAPTFTVTEADHKKVIFERIFLKGSRFAKIAAAPLKLNEPKFHRATAERKSLFTLLFRIADIARDRAGRRFGGTYDSFTVHDDIWAQFDGETVRVPAGTHVEMRIGEQPFYALSTKLIPYTDQ